MSNPESNIKERNTEILTEATSEAVIPREHEHGPLTVTWRTIVEIPLENARNRQLSGSLDDADGQIAQHLEKLAKARQIIQAIRSLHGSDGWEIALSSRKVHLERQGEPFESLEEELSGRFDPEDFVVRVEYARAWGML